MYKKSGLLTNAKKLSKVLGNMAEWYHDTTKWQPCELWQERICNMRDTDINTSLLTHIKLCHTSAADMVCEYS